MAYEQDGESDQLISRATWSLKLSGLVFAGLLVLGRSASSGNVVWNPTFHGASSPLVVVLKAQAPQNPVPPIPKTAPNIDNAALSKRAAASEVIAFSAGKNADAKANLQKYLELDPNGKDAATAKEMLKYVK